MAMPLSRIWLSLMLIFLAVTSVSMTSVSVAATPPPSPDLTESTDKSPPATPEEIDRARQVELTEPPPIQETARESDYFYQYRQGLLVRGGLLLDFNQADTLGSDFGFQYRFPFRNSQRLEIGADLLNEGVGILHAARFHFLDDSRMRWFYKYGLGIRIVPAQQLVTFLKLANWQARIGGGLEWTIEDPFSIRLDLESTFSTEKLTAISTIGVTYGW
ncbi:MAG: hypothetical protein J0L82_06535 [Deltaproteobacteria bacterium]|nr:hypothetical protein [Deltaproteobacteria bacterium]